MKNSRVNKSVFSTALMFQDELNELISDYLALGVINPTIIKNVLFVKIGNIDLVESCSGNAFDLEKLNYV